MSRFVFKTLLAVWLFGTTLFVVLTPPASHANEREKLVALLRTAVLCPLPCDGDCVGPNSSQIYQNVQVTDGNVIKVYSKWEQRIMSFQTNKFVTVVTIGTAIARLEDLEIMPLKKEAYENRGILPKLLLQCRRSQCIDMETVMPNNQYRNKDNKIGIFFCGDEAADNAKFALERIMKSSPSLPRQPAGTHAPKDGIQCVVADPTGTPLNVRSSPNGDLTGHRLTNGTNVLATADAEDASGRPWAQVKLNGRVLGYVFKAYIKCG